MTEASIIEPEHGYPSYLLPGALILLLIAAAGLGYSAAAPAAWLFASFTLTTLIISWFLPARQTRSLQVRIQQTAEAVYPGKVMLTCYFSCPRPLYGVSMMVDIPGLTRQTFFFASLQPGSQSTLTLEASRRGCFRLGEIQLQSDWPFGIFMRRSRVDIAATALLIQPAISHLRQLPLPSVTTGRAQPNHDGSITGTDWYGLQHSQRNTPAQRCSKIGHPQWQPSCSRQYEQEKLPEYLLLLDCNETPRTTASSDQPGPTLLDFALHIAASILDHASTGKAIVHLCCSGRHPIRLTLQPQHHSRIDFCQQLTLVTTDNSQSYQALAERELATFGTATVITIRQCEKPAALPPINRPHIDIRLHQASFGNPMGSYKEGWETPSAQQRILTLHANSTLSRFFLNA